MSTRAGTERPSQYPMAVGFAGVTDVRTSNTGDYQSRTMTAVGVVLVVPIAPPKPARQPEVLDRVAEGVEALRSGDIRTAVGVGDYLFSVHPDLGLEETPPEVSAFRRVYELLVAQSEVHVRLDDTEGRTVCHVEATPQIRDRSGAEDAWNSLEVADSLRKLSLDVHLAVSPWMVDTSQRLVYDRISGGTCPLEPQVDEGSPESGIVTVCLGGEVLATLVFPWQGDTD
ncbi:MAG: hypothetical protein GTO63_36255 [Anaerolineae bacterium]|nr:hypothetical protein [Anaerolineae bacterium]NIO00208.1 hypothetical protein [Anaerolineae bacterium]NIQ82980.1 hypothetical protein [Anaerolineae bacterium]